MDFINFISRKDIVPYAHVTSEKRSEGEKTTYKTSVSLIHVPTGGAIFLSPYGSEGDDAFSWALPAITETAVQAETSCEANVFPHESEVSDMLAAWALEMNKLLRSSKTGKLAVFLYEEGEDAVKNLPSIDVLVATNALCIDHVTVNKFLCSLNAAVETYMNRPVVQVLDFLKAHSLTFHVDDSQTTEIGRDGKLVTKLETNVCLGDRHGNKDVLVQYNDCIRSFALTMPIQIFDGIRSGTVQTRLRVDKALTYAANRLVNLINENESMVLIIGDSKTEVGHLEMKPTRRLSVDMLRDM